MNRLPESRSEDDKPRHFDIAVMSEGATRRRGMVSLTLRPVLRPTSFCLLFGSVVSSQAISLGMLAYALYFSLYQMSDDAPLRNTISYYLTEGLTAAETWGRPHGTSLHPRG